jgi:hypothetical protein
VNRKLLTGIIAEVVALGAIAALAVLTVLATTMDDGLGKNLDSAGIRQLYDKSVGLSDKLVYALNRLNAEEATEGETTVSEGEWTADISQPFKELDEVLANLSNFDPDHQMIKSEVIAQLTGEGNEPQYTYDETTDALTDPATGTVYTANNAGGYFESPEGMAMEPLWVVFSTRVPEEYRNAAMRDIISADYTMKLIVDDIDKYILDRNTTLLWGDIEAERYAATLVYDSLSKVDTTTLQ